VPIEAKPLTAPFRIAPAVAVALAGCVVAGPAWSQAPSRAGAGTNNPVPFTDDQQTLGLRLGDTDQTPNLSPTASPGAANYGRPAKRPDPRLAYSGRRKTSRNALPALVPSTAPSVQRSNRSLPAPLPNDTVPLPQPGPTIATIPQIPRKTRPRVEEDPFAPIGIGVGNLRLVPYVSEDAGYDSNPNRSPTSSQGSAILRTEGGLALKSDWSRHALTGEIHGAYTKVLRDQTASRPEGQGQLNLRLDATRDTQFNFELRGNLDSQRPGSTELSETSVKSRPLVVTYGGTAGVTQALGRVSLGLRGTIDRTNYEDATLFNGTQLRLSANDYTAYGVQGRFAYQVNPALTPFVEVQADTRKRDEAIDPDGYARNSNGLAVRVGSSFELSRLVTGQASVGYLTRDYADSRLSKLSAPTFDASLIWTATPLTTVTLRGATVANETTVAGASGSIGRTMSVEVSHALLRNLKLGVIATLGTNDYQGIDLQERTLTGTVKAEYNLTRSISVRGSFSHERLKSTAVGSDYTANVFLLGLKLQR
jgi:hypothetical protein